MAYLPTWCSTSLYDLDLNFLKSQNISYLLIDLDNTLAPYNIKKPSTKTIDYINYLKQEGFNVIVVSNNTGNRVKTYASELNVDYCSGAKKPFITPLKNFLNQRKINLDSCVLIGDQMMTDIKCANRLKIKSILTTPLSKDESIVTFFNRLMDNHYRKKYKLDKKEKIDRGVSK